MGNVDLNRLDAMALLKELAANNLVDPSYLLLCLRKPDNYKIQIKCDYQQSAIEEYAKKHGLTMQEDKERKYLVIYKP